MGPWGQIFVLPCASSHPSNVKNKDLILGDTPAAEGPDQKGMNRLSHLLSQAILMADGKYCNSRRYSVDPMLNALRIAFCTLPTTLQSPIMKNLPAAPKNPSADVVHGLHARGDNDAARLEGMLCAFGVRVRHLIRPNTRAACLHDSTGGSAASPMRPGTCCRNGQAGHWERASLPSPTG